MFRKLYRFGRVRLFSPLGIVIVSALILLDEVMREGYFFRFSDIFTPILTHEKFLVGLFMVGVISHYRRVRVLKKARHERLSQKV